jgi:hypothetical protein
MSATRSGVEAGRFKGRSLGFHVEIFCNKAMAACAFSFLSTLALAGAIVGDRPAVVDSAAYPLLLAPGDWKVALSLSFSSTPANIRTLKLWM